MALINCPECGKEISNKAMTCIHCGFPISEISKTIDVEPFPELPNNLSVSKLLTNWTGDTVLYAHYFSEQKFSNFTNGCYTIELHRYGLSITKDLTTILNIHQSQIIDIYEYKDTVAVNQSATEKAVIGGLLFGPVGAVVGGVSGDSKIPIDGSVICIKFWDIKTKSKIILSFLASKKPDKFIRRCKEELSFGCNNVILQETAPLTEEEEEEKNKRGCLTAIIVGIIIFVILLVIMKTI